LGLCLIAAGLVPAWALHVLIVVIALGMVIFVHELGHFLVAKACGVKCEKFYLGFDIFGLKIWRFTWGETEYGVGILPLGGYVKMLGQEDNPARLREELERAQAQENAAAEGRDGPQPDTGTPADDATVGTPEPIDLEAAKRALFDPRSYLAQSVPERMAIISAGVIMNVIFAFAAAAVAFGIGVEQVDSTVGAVVPGDAAWQLGLEVGDKIVAIGGKPIRRFTDLKKAISLGDNLDAGITLSVERPGLPKRLEVPVTPDQSGLAPTIGVGLPWSTTLRKEFAARPATAAANARPGFEGGDRIVAVDGKPVERYADVFEALARDPDRPLDFTVRRAGQPAHSEGSARPGEKEVGVRVAANPMLRLGLVMEMGPIAAIRKGSQAAQKGILAGDWIREVNGEPPGDPMTLPDRLRRLAQDSSQVELTVARLGRKEPIRVEMPLHPVDSFDSLVAPDSPISLPSLGIAYRVSNRVQEVLAGSPAARAGLQPRAVIVRAATIPPDEKSLVESLGSEKPAEFPIEAFDVDLSEEERNWPHFFHALQRYWLPGTKVAITLKGGQEVELVPSAAEDWHNPDRGLIFNLSQFTEKAATPGEALQLGFGETIDALTMVFRTIQKLSTRQVSMKLLGGPGTIAKEAYYAAAQGPADLLIFLCIISANLAVLNFLPIPVLDGGHMVFLAYEGIRRKPPSEAVQVWLSYVGLALILALMLWVIGLDIGVVSRQ